MKVTMLACLLMVILVTACATKLEWTQEGKTEADTERDYDECYTQTSQRYGTNLKSPHFTVDLNQCMESRGYKRK